MSAMEILALATSFSLLSGWRLYFSLFATGMAMRFDLIELPAQLASLDILASPWILAAAGTGMIAEFFADKIAWLDSAWDAVHSFIRPVGGALIALAIVDPSSAEWQIVTFLLGGGVALLSHGVKSATRTVVNASPEPFSNAVVSASEDVATFGLAALALANPVAAVVIAACLLVASVIALLALRRLLRRLLSQIKSLGTDAGASPAEQ
jgi:hypothetical protein